MIPGALPAAALAGALLALLPAAAQAQYVDAPDTLTVVMEGQAPYVYRDAGGHAVVVGAVENNDARTSISGVRVVASFYGDSGPEPLAVAEGGTVLGVIPPGSSSPYVIRSPSPDQSITRASASVAGFGQSVPKEEGISLGIGSVFVDSELHVEAVLQNGQAPSNSTLVYIALYDSFDPPRIIGVETVGLGPLGPGEEAPVSFAGPVDARAAEVRMAAESDVFHSPVAAARIPPPEAATRAASILGVSVRDAAGDPVALAHAGEPVIIGSDTLVRFPSDPDSGETRYSYYVQVRESGRDPRVEFVGVYEGRFIGDGVAPQEVRWTPARPGLYLVETFLWDDAGIPLADPGPVALVAVG